MAPLQVCIKLDTDLVKRVDHFRIAKGLNTTEEAVLGLVLSGLNNFEYRGSDARDDVAAIKKKLDDLKLMLEAMGPSVMEPGAYMTFTVNDELLEKTRSHAQGVWEDLVAGRGVILETSK